jgi:hypothetical protein
VDVVDPDDGVDAVDKKHKLHDGDFLFYT